MIIISGIMARMEILTTPNFKTIQMGTYWGLKGLFGWVFRGFGVGWKFELQSKLQWPVGHGGGLGSIWVLHGCISVYEYMCV